MNDQEDTLSKIQQQVADRQQEETDHIPLPEEEQVDPTDDSAFIQQCLEHNERGDGILFATLHRGRFVYVKSRDEKAKAWFRWTGHHWQIDKADFHHAAVEDVALIFQREGDGLKPSIDEARNELAEANDSVKHYNKLYKELNRDSEVTPDALADCDREGQKAEQTVARAAAQMKYLVAKQKEFTARVKRLRGLKGAKNCAEYAHKLGRQGLWIYGDEVDQKPMLLPCANGVIDLETGLLTSGNPDDYLVRAIPVEFLDINAPSPVWERVISEIHMDDPDLIEFIHRFFGYCLLGADPEQMYAFFIGEGANGKGLMFEILREILGDLSWSINPEMLLDSKNVKSPDGPSPAIMSMQGRRLIVASETDEGRKMSGANLKRYTGQDTLTGRNLFDKYDTNFRPTHTLAIYSNHAPRGLTADFALIRRLLYIEYLLRYVEDVEYWKKQEPQNAHLFRKKDGDLKAKLQAEKPGILAWLVRGCLKYQNPKDKGLKIPDSIRAAVEEVRKKEDFQGQFLEALCHQTPPENCVLFASIYDRFKKWYAETHGNGNGKNDDRFIPKKRKFGEQLRKKGYVLPDPITTGGKLYVSGVSFEGALYDDQYSWADAPTGGPGDY